jgi:hypothetical protein
MYYLVVIKAYQTFFQSLIRYTFSFSLCCGCCLMPFCMDGNKVVDGKKKF